MITTDENDYQSLQSLEEAWEKWLDDYCLEPLATHPARPSSQHNSFLMGLGKVSLFPRTTWRREFYRPLESLHDAWFSDWRKVGLDLHSAMKRHRMANEPCSRDAADPRATTVIR